MPYPHQTGREFVRQAKTEEKKEAKKMDPLSAKKEDPGKKSYEDIKSSLNGQSVAFNLITPLACHPGLMSDTSKFEQAVDKINKLFSEVYGKVNKDILPPNSHPALRASLRRSVSSFVGSMWKESARASVKGQDINSDLLASLYKKMFDMAEPEPDMVFSETLSADQQVEMSVSSAMSKISPYLLRVENFGPAAKFFFGKNSFEDIALALKKEIRDRALSRCSDIEDSGSKDWMIVFKHGVNNISSACAQIIDSDINRVGKMIKSMPEEKKRDFLKEVDKYPLGPLFSSVKRQLDSVEKVAFAKDNTVKQENLGVS